MVGRKHTVDGIVLGAGHNGLILAAYAARAELEVVVIERRDEAGGALTTVDDPAHPGFRHNTHAFFHRAITTMPWYRDLDLERHGLRYLEPERNVVLILEDGRTLEWWTDLERTIASIAGFSRRDADTARRWHDRFRPVMERILIPEATSPPLPAEERRRLLERSAEGRLLLETSRLSPLEFVRREFEHPVVQAGLLFFNGLREVDLRLAGFGHHIPALLASPAKAQMAVGGSKALADALAAAVGRAGGTIRTGIEPRRILVENGRAAGVETTAGDVIRARRFVASSLNPQQTFLQFLDDGDRPTGLGELAQRYQYNLLAPLFGLNLALDEVPVYRALDPADPPPLMTILGLDHVDRFHDIVRHHEAGTIPPTVMWGACPTLHDPSQGPPGGHTAFMWEKLPYAVHGDAGSWDRLKEQHGRTMLDLWRRYAPNLESAVRGSMVQSPLDTERAFPNMTGGDLLVGSFANGQLGHGRPFEGAGAYRTPVPGLYLCGSCCHPGGNITGLPGYNAAQVLMCDLGLAPDWRPPPLAERLPCR
jgi:phytoene dehydrogenase-like protein